MELRSLQVENLKALLAQPAVRISKLEIRVLQGIISGDGDIG